MLNEISDVSKNLIDGFFFLQCSLNTIKNNIEKIQRKNTLTGARVITRDRKARVDA